jgi:hypothetical protein
VYEHRIFEESRREPTRHCSPGPADHLPRGCCVGWTFLFGCCGADGVGTLVLLQPDQDVHTELNRWFLTVAGSVDAITAGVLLALAQRPRRTLLVVELAAAVVVAGAIILPFPALLRRHPRGRGGAADHLPVLARVRTFPSWWVGVSRSVLILAALAGAGLLVTAAIAYPR